MVGVPVVPGPTVPVEGVELLWLDLHLASPHRAAYGEESARPVVVARVVTSDGEGWGECAALAGPSYRDEYAAGAWDVLCHHLVPRLLGLDVPAAAPPGPGPGGHGPDPLVVGTLAAVGSALAAVQGHPMAKACLEMAVVDAALAAAGRSLAGALGVTATTVPAGAVLGLAEDAGRTVAEAERAVDLGFRRLRCKIAPGRDVAPLQALRERFPSLVLQADGNGSYDRAGAGRLRALDPLGLACLEQPLPADDLLGHAELARQLATPVCLDESLRCPADVDVAAAVGAASLLCLKPPCLGGIAGALDAVGRAAAAGLGVWCGGMLQTALGRAVDAAVSGLSGFVLPGDLGGPGAVFAEVDPFGAVPWHGGAVTVHHRPGVGPRPDAGALRSVVTRRHLGRRRARTA